MQRPAFALKSSIPVLRMLDETKSREFYIDFLGYNVDWEHRFNDDPSSPLYMQISHGESILHLNGHAESESPAAEVRIPVSRLREFCRFLCQKVKGDEKPEVVDPRYEGRPTDMNLQDPSGNMLVFWTPSWIAEQETQN